ncbi:MAG: hypothetical protein KatS3mg111_0012 [Pirellulaceae bacterium]|nr:MAG: hypothetical protein KatS3mg111_0012 [Pirellulaceae bacterium]
MAIARQQNQPSSEARRLPAVFARTCWPETLGTPGKGWPPFFVVSFLIPTLSIEEPTQ